MHSKVAPEELVIESGDSLQKNLPAFFVSKVLLIGAAFLSAITLAFFLENLLIYWAIFLLVVFFSCALKINSQIVFAFALWVFLPTEYITQNPLQGYLNPSSAIFLIFLLRTRTVPTRADSLYLLVFAVFLVMATLASSDLQRSSAWSLQTLLLVYGLSCLGKLSKQLSRESVFLGIALVTYSVCGLAFAELLTSSSLVYDGRFLPTFWESWRWQNYSIYRVTTTIGHPLANGLFFSSAALLLFRQATQAKLRFFYFGSALLSTFAVFLSGSRSAILGLVAGLSIWLILEWRRIGSSTKAWLLLLAPTSLLIFVQSELFDRIFVRIGSGEGISSQTYREDLLLWAGYFSSNFFLTGSGPGVSGDLWLSYGNLNPLENGFMQLWASLGLVPTILISLATVIFIYRQTRIRPSVAVSCIPSFIYLPLTNFVDASSSYLIFIAMMVVLSSANSQYPMKNHDGSV